MGGAVLEEHRAAVRLRRHVRPRAPTRLETVQPGQAEASRCRGDLARDLRGPGPGDRDAVRQRRRDRPREGGRDRAGAAARRPRPGGAGVLGRPSLDAWARPGPVGSGVWTYGTCGESGLRKAGAAVYVAS